MICTSDGVVDVEAILSIRTEASVHLRQLRAHEFRSLRGSPTPHVEVLEDCEATWQARGACGCQLVRDGAGKLTGTHEEVFSRVGRRQLCRILLLQVFSR